jgi:hypothetical protein
MRTGTEVKNSFVFNLAGFEIFNEIQVAWTIGAERPTAFEEIKFHEQYHPKRKSNRQVAFI